MSSSGAFASALLGCFLLSVVGCAREQPEREPDITGVITAAVPDGGEARLGTIRVETVPEDEWGTPKASVTITGATHIEVGSRAAEGNGFGVLREGERVHVWFIGPVLESYPVQATAERVVVVGEGS